MALAKVIPSGRSTAPQEGHWIPLTDLMSGLMMMFMLVAVVFMLKVEAESEKVKELMREAERQAELMRALAAKAEQQAQRMKDVAILYDEMRERLYADLQAEFRADLPRWRATLERDLSIRFEEPEVLFKSGDASLQIQFVRILDDFVPAMFASSQATSTGTRSKRSASRGTPQRFGWGGAVPTRHTSRTWSFRRAGLGAP
jgi:outer membrane protein OmpA-like peptidoglycan-associated protein